MPNTQPEHAFAFQNPGILRDGELELILVAAQCDPELHGVPTYHFEMQNRLTAERTAMGTIRLRIGSANDRLRFAGHLGYDVTPEHRGHRYSARSIRLLLPLARKHGLKALWLGCDPGNRASRRICELVGACLIETVRVPPSAPMYKEGHRFLCRYRLDI